MQENLWSTAILWLVLVVVPGASWAQVNRQSRTLIINGQAGQAEVIKIDGRSYVDMDALARITNGSLRFKASRILLTLPVSAASAPASVPASAPPPTSTDHSGFSQ